MSQIFFSNSYFYRNFALTTFVETTYRNSEICHKTVYLHTNQLTQYRIDLKTGESQLKYIQALTPTFLINKLMLFVQGRGLAGYDLDALLVSAVGYFPLNIAPMLELLAAMTTSETAAIQVKHLFFVAFMVNYNYRVGELQLLTTLIIQNCIQCPYIYIN